MPADPKPRHHHTGPVKLTMRDGSHLYWCRLSDDGPDWLDSAVITLSYAIEGDMRDTRVDYELWFARGRPRWRHLCGG
jgi:hypothetical protein